MFDIFLIKCFNNIIEVFAMKRFISTFVLIIFCMTFFAGCGNTPPPDYPIKQAMVAIGKAESYNFDITLKGTIDEKIMPKDNDSYADFYAYAEGSSLTASNKIMFTDKSRTVGLISSDVTYIWAKKNDNSNNSDAPNTYKFNVVTSFNFKNLEKNRPTMSLVQAYKFSQMPKRIYEKMGFSDNNSNNSYRDKYFSIILSDNEVLKEYFKKMLAKGVPNWGEMLSSMNWKKDKKDYVIAISQEILKTAAGQMLDSFNFDFSSEDKSRIDNIFKAIELSGTDLKYTVGDDGRLSQANWTFTGTLDYYTLNNFVLGRNNGFDIKIPMTASLSIKFSNHDTVEKFSFPTLTDDNTVNYTTTKEYVPDVMPKLNKIKKPYEEEQIVVNINGRKIEFFESYPPCIVDDKVYLPLKYMYQTRGGLVTSEIQPDGRWRATAKAGVKTSILLQNSKIISLQGVNEELSAPIMIHWDYNTFYAPYDLFKLAFDMDCKIDATQKTASGKNKFIFDYVSLSEQ